MQGPLSAARAESRPGTCFICGTKVVPFNYGGDRTCCWSLDCKAEYRRLWGQENRPAKTLRREVVDFRGEPGLWVHVLECGHEVRALGPCEAKRFGRRVCRVCTAEDRASRGIPPPGPSVQMD
jgi:hypothetical protein